MGRFDFVTSLGDVSSLEGEPLMLGQIKALHGGEAIVVGYEGGSWKAETRLGDRGERSWDRGGGRRRGERGRCRRWSAGLVGQENTWMGRKIVPWRACTECLGKMAKALTLKKSWRVGPWCPLTMDLEMW